MGGEYITREEKANKGKLQITKPDTCITMRFFLYKLLLSAIHPLGIGIGLQILALGIDPNHGWKLILEVSSIVTTWIFSMPLTSRELIWSLESQVNSQCAQSVQEADAIVILGGWLKQVAATDLKDSDFFDSATRIDSRLAAGIKLFKENKAPLLVTSGANLSFRGEDSFYAEAFVGMNIAVDLGVPNDHILINASSRTTAEEAFDIGLLGRQNGWRRILLVTSAFHMPRALATFRKRSGLIVVPVACDYKLPPRVPSGGLTSESIIMGLIPDATALSESTVALKEQLGLIFYRLKRWC